jgi:hypothetical protein
MPAWFVLVDRCSPVASSTTEALALTMTCPLTSLTTPLIDPVETAFCARTEAQKTAAIARRIGAKVPFVACISLLRQLQWFLGKYPEGPDSVERARPKHEARFRSAAIASVSGTMVPLEICLFGWAGDQKIQTNRRSVNEIMYTL